jgi:hypothetical protein
MDITVTASAKKGERALTDLLGREMGCVTETVTRRLQDQASGAGCCDYGNADFKNLFVA